MRKLVVLLTGVAILALVNYSIYQKEQLLANGRAVFLRLAPVDPRSLMQGDYMALRFAVENNIPWTEHLRDGHLVVAVDDRGVAEFRRVDNGSPLAANELRLYYRAREGRLRIGSNAFFFQEGDADFYAAARFAEARVDHDGELLLVGLYDENLKRLGRPAPERQ